MLILDPINIYGMNEARNKRFLTAIKRVEDLINNQDFATWFLDTPFTEIEDVSSLTKPQQLLKLRSLTPFDYAVVPRPWYKRFSSVVGWTDFIKELIGPIGNKSIPYVSTYTDTFDGMTDAELAGHLAHEIVCHGNGFTHSVNPSPSRDNSVPYKVGNYVIAKIQKL